MLDYRARSRTDTWPEPSRRLTVDPAAATMAQSTVCTIEHVPGTPAYAWSVEPSTADPLPTERAPRLLSPMAAAAAGAGAVAAIATLFVVFGGSPASTAVATPTASVPIVTTPVAAATPMPQAPARARTTNSTAPHPQARSSHSTTRATPYPSITMPNEYGQGQYHDDDVRPSHDRSSWQRDFLRALVSGSGHERSEHHDGTHERGDERSSETHSHPSDGPES